MTLDREAVEALNKLFSKKNAADQVWIYTRPDGVLYARFDGDHVAHRLSRPHNPCDRLLPGYDERGYPAFNRYATRG